MFNSFGDRSRSRDRAVLHIAHNAYGVLGQDSYYFIHSLTQHFGTKNLSVRDREVVIWGLELSRLSVFAASTTLTPQASLY